MDAEVEICAVARHKSVADQGVWIRIVNPTTTLSAKTVPFTFSLKGPA